MKHKHKQKVIIGALILIIIINFIWFNGLVKSNITNIEAINGVVNLSNNDLNKNIIKLNGEWLYYDSLLVEDLAENMSEQEIAEVKTIPEYKKDKNTESFFRYGTYQLTVEGLEPDKAYGIYSGSQVTSYQLYVNNKVYLFNGKVGRNKETSVPEWKSKNSVVYTDSKGRLVFQMEISNYLYDDGLFWNSPYIGDTDHIFRYHTNQIVVAVLLNALFLIIGLVFLSLYFYVKHDKSVFYYAIFILVMSVRMFFTSSRPVMLLFPNISWEIVVRWEYLSGYLLLPAIIVFIAYLMDYSKVIYVRNICLSISIAITIFVLTTDHLNYTQFLNPYLYLAMFIIVISIILLLLHYRKHVFYEIILILSFINLLIGVVQQIYGDAATWIPIAVFNFFLGFSFILLDQFRTYIRNQEAIVINAAIDPLTSLYNRQYLVNFSKSTFKDMFDLNMTYVLFLDIDGFKQVNDTYGHDIGDEVMQIIGRRLKNCFASTDYVFRYGGDEFVAIAVCDHIECIKRRVKLVLKSINDPIVINETHHQVGISIGITHCEMNKTFEVEDYINASDKAMYSAKMNGGNRYEFSK